MGHEMQSVKGAYSNLTPTLELQVAEALQARWDGHRESLAPEAVLVVEPRSAKVRVKPGA